VAPASWIKIAPIRYGEPPKATQFKPGQSGNPRGRPKGSRTISAILREVIGQKIAVTEGGKTRRLQALEVMRRLVNEAMRSDPKAIKLLLSLVERYGESSDLAPHLDQLLAGRGTSARAPRHGWTA
jgi:hypothetical protein